MRAWAIDLLDEQERHALRDRMQARFTELASTGIFIQCTDVPARLLLGPDGRGTTVQEILAASAASGRYDFDWLDIVRASTVTVHKPVFPVVSTSLMHPDEDRDGSRSLVAIPDRGKGEFDKNDHRVGMVCDNEYDRYVCENGVGMDMFHLLFVANNLDEIVEALKGIRIVDVNHGDQPTWGA